MDAPVVPPLVRPVVARPVIALLAAPATSPSVLYGLYDVLGSVGAVFPDMTIGEPGDALLDVRIVAAGTSRSGAWAGS